MATNNTRVAAYLPQDITDALNAFKLERGLIHVDTKDEKGLRANDSQALITILAEYFGVSQEVAHPTVFDLVKRIERIESRLNGFEREKVARQLSTGKLAERLGMHSSTLSHWKSSNPKKRKSPSELLKATREKDPEGIGWSFDDEKKAFLPERPLGSSPSNLQGELLAG